jgi:hypothetical protein
MPELIYHHITGTALSNTLKTGTIPLYLTSAREIATNATINAAGNGGLLASNTTPTFTRINGATDKCLKLTWASSNSDEIQWQVISPYDMDGSATVALNFYCAMGGATDTPTTTVGFFDGHCRRCQCC